MNVNFHPGRRLQTFYKNHTSNPAVPHNWEVGAIIDGESVILGKGQTLAEAEAAARYEVGTKHQPYFI